ncbi:hypothetical protein QYM36_008963 [Artemia franciscana]|uniref:RRM domain-containing protein n=1 Tax=Artemia franciscana TaxID=6661 RepID=A0AA88L2Z2_ARTSF|nr:hypothetical protein QYM36_008963 [Artemia franciscana]
MSVTVQEVSSRPADFPVVYVRPTDVQSSSPALTIPYLFNKFQEHEVLRILIFNNYDQMTCAFIEFKNHITAKKVVEEFSTNESMHVTISNKRHLDIKFTDPRKSWDFGKNGPLPPCPLEIKKLKSSVTALQLFNILSPFGVVHTVKIENGVAVVQMKHVQGIANILSEFNGVHFFDQKLEVKLLHEEFLPRVSRSSAHYMSFESTIKNENKKLKPRIESRLFFKIGVNEVFREVLGKSDILKLFTENQISEPKVHLFEERSQYCCGVIFFNSKEKSLEALALLKNKRFATQYGPKVFQLTFYEVLGSFLELENISVDLNCDKLFNILCLFGNVREIFFTGDHTAIVEMKNENDSQQVCNYLNQQIVFGKQLNIKISEKRIGISDSDEKVRKDGTSSFRLYENSGVNTPSKSRRLQAPGKTLHFYNVPKNTTKECFRKFLLSCKAPEPVITYYANKHEHMCSGYLNLKSVEDALATVALCNNKMIDPNNQLNFRLAFVAARA